MKSLLERMNGQGDSALKLATEFAEIAENLQKQNDELTIRNGGLVMRLGQLQRKYDQLENEKQELQKAYECEGCLCSLYEELQRKYRELEQELADRPCKSYDEEFC